MFCYTRAICRKVSKSIVDGGIRMRPNQEPLNYELAQQQHDAYVQALNKAGAKVTLIEADDDFPDCVFTEDTAVTDGNKVLITNPGALSRQKEVAPVKSILEQWNEFQIKEMSKSSSLEGGDVIFTGKEFFVGISRRTNENGFKTLRDYFSEYPVHSIEVGSGTLHLKTIITVGPNNILFCGESETPLYSLEQILKKAEYKYDVVHVKDDHAANCVLVNDTLLCRSNKEYPESFAVIDKKVDIEKIQLDWSELEKVDGSLTCCSVLFK